MVEDLIWKYKLEKHSEIRDELIKQIYKQGGKFGKYNGSNAFSDIQLQESEKRYSEYFVPYLDGFLNQVLMKSGCNVVDYHYWYVRYIQKGQLSWHIHHNCHMSAVYYLKLDSGEDATEFYDPSTQNIYKPDVEEGDIVFFPAYLPHRSRTINSDREKIVMSINFNLGIDRNPIIAK
jgi:hypothetical protein